VLSYNSITSIIDFPYSNFQPHERSSEICLLGDMIADYDSVASTAQAFICNTLGEIGARAAARLQPHESSSETLEAVYNRL
jgi:hypothetical protein